MKLTVPQYYAGKSILITGGTGFLGKALVEKLLRTCPDVKTIYLLLRAKKGLSGEERLKELCSHKLFFLVRDKNPEAFNKLRFVGGDIAEDGLGMSEQDKEELLQNCNIIFHSAACVRFDQKLKDAVNMNTTGTLRMLTLAESMKNLEVFVHLSTAYCRCELDVLEERLYPAVHKPRKIIEMTQWMDDSTLQFVEPKIIESEPNTYSYTKAITEDLVGEYSGKFPVAIARPSIVTASLKEPVPGWVDGLNGPSGLIVGSGKGVIRTMHCEPSYTADAIAVDVVVNGCILIAYVTALDKPKEAQVYNLTMSKMPKISWNEIIKLGEYWVNKYPFTMALWYPGGSIKSYWITHQIHLFFAHTIPAYLVDGLLFLTGKKTFLVALQKRINRGLDVLQYYTTKEWNFTNTKFKSLRNRITAEDDETFFTDLSGADPKEYLKNYVLGVREFICKEDRSTLPRARKLHRIRFIVDRTFKIILFGLLVWWLYSYIHVFTTSVEILDTTLKSFPPIAVKADMQDVCQASDRLLNI
ncbi:hypothetical protein K1T71_000871 [Dendrolimus kikuchii]|uniref:Uncharacterized protein n=1 Tax=Dendrolimus kikuchii TaxID=765133 RepID=A0ACC1DG59_9NEOP|nr:hypothetical protein K1T71_000871 [Dendrolimus kikuchii]